MAGIIRPQRPWEVVSLDLEPISNAGCHRGVACRGAENALLDHAGDLVGSAVVWGAADTLLAVRRLNLHESRRLVEVATFEGLAGRFLHDHHEYDAAVDGIRLVVF